MVQFWHLLITLCATVKCTRLYCFSGYIHIIMSHTYPLPLLTRSIFKKLCIATQIWFPLTKTLNKNLKGSMNLMICIKFTMIMHQLPLSGTVCISDIIFPVFVCVREIIQNCKATKHAQCWTLIGLRETITLNKTSSQPMHKDMYFWSATYGY